MASIKDLAEELNIPEVGQQQKQGQQQTVNISIKSLADEAGVKPKQKKGTMGELGGIVEQEKPKESLLKRATSFITKDILGGGIKGETNMAGEIFKETVGSKGAAGVGQEVAKNLYSVASGGQYEKEATKLSESIGGLAEQTTKLIKSLPSVEEGERKERLKNMIKSNLQTISESNSTYKDLVNVVDALESPQESARNYASNVLNAGLTALTGQGKIVEGLAAKAIGKTSIGTLMKYPKLLPTAEKVLSYGKGLLPRVAEQAGIGAGFVASENLREGRPLGENVKAGALFGAGIPVGGTLLSKAKATVAGEKTASRIINSLIKTKRGSFSYGKNPGLGVAREGIIFNSLTEGEQKIATKLSEIGTEMDKVANNPRYANKTYDFTEVLVPIAKEIKKLTKERGYTETTNINKLKNILYDLTGRIDNKDGTFTYTKNIKNISLPKAIQLKRDIASFAKYTGINNTDDKLLNKVIQESANKAKNKVNFIAPEMRKLNERWANLKTAHVAIRDREALLQGQNLIKFNPKLIGGGSLIAGAATFNPAIIAFGFLNYGIDALLSSSAFKTRLAKWLTKSTPTDRALLLRDAPFIKPILDRIFGQNKELKEKEISIILDNIQNERTGFASGKYPIKKQPLLLPEGGKSTGLPIILGARSQSTIDSQEMQRIQAQLVRRNLVAKNKSL